MSQTTGFHVTNDTRPFHRLHNAKRAADAQARQTRVEVQVTDDDGKLLHQASVMPKDARRAANWHRTESVRPSWVPDAMEGYVFAYVRETGQISIWHDLDQTHWIAVSNLTGERRMAGNTKLMAKEVTSMITGFRAAKRRDREAAKALAKAARAAARAAR